MKLRTRELSNVLWPAASLLIAIIVASTPAASQDVAAGAEVFKSKCVVCHGPDGSGNTAVGKSLKVADLRSAEIQKKSDAELTQSISDGKNNMPGFKGDLSDDDIHAVLSYVRTLAAKGDSAPKKK
jgi:cytochrome c6